MEISYVLRAKNPDSNNWYELLFDTDEGRLAVTEDWSIKKFGELQKTDKIRIIKLGPRARRTAFIFKYDTTKSPYEPQKSQGKLLQPLAQKMKAVVDLIRNDPRVFVVNESPRVTTSMIFELENPVQTDERRMEVSDKKFEAYNIARKYSKGQLRDIAYYFGVSPSEKSETELRSELFDMTDGVVMNDDVPPGEDMSNLDKFLNEYSKESPIAKIKMEVNKALKKGVIREARGIYYYREQPLGGGYDSIIAFMSSNTSIYSAMMSEANRGESEDSNEKEPSQNTFEGDDIETLRGIGRELGVPSFHNKSRDKLVAGIREARALRLLAEVLDVDANQNVNRLIEDVESKGINWKEDRHKWEAKLDVAHA